MKSKTVKRLPKYLKDEEVKNLLDKCEGRRDRLIIELILLTGLRVSEVLGITPLSIEVWKTLNVRFLILIFILAFTCLTLPILPILPYRKYYYVVRYHNTMFGTKVSNCKLR